MAKTMTTSEMTDGQIERAIEIFRAQLRKHKGELPSDAVQTVLGQAELGPEWFAVLRDRVEAVRGTIVTVDRSVRPAYPNWMDKVMHPELECTSPAEYDLATQVSLWLHDDQKSGVTTGQTIYDYLKDNSILESCLGLSDALAIQKLGAEVFQKVFGNNVVYFWKSVVRRRAGGDLRVPCLYVGGDEVVLNWRWLGRGWDDNEPAVRFASSPACNA